MLLLLIWLLLVFLAPITIYCLILGSLNRRWNPVMVPGVWDCVGLLFAVSGFFLAVVPAILHKIYVNSVRGLPFGDDNKDGFEELVQEWWAIFLTYFAVLAAGTILLLWLRRRKTVVYNVDPADFDRAFSQVLARLGLEKTRSGELLIIGPATREDSTQLLAGEGIVEGKPSPGRTPPPAGPPAIVRVDPFPALCNVTLHWNGQAPQLRRDIETDLNRALKHVQTHDNPAATWILGIGGILLGILFLMVVVMVMLTYFPRR